MNHCRFLVPVLAGLLGALALAQNPQEESQFDFLQLDLVADGFVSPVTLAAPVGDDRLFVVDRPGVVYMLDQDGSRAEEP
ncbi:MAG: hypothetical protein IT345_10830, partial [Trueperaceae bacterium]|nr:hypothetical protein [Trueperaceae bacterium]